MNAGFGTCPKHKIKYRGRCPRCHPRRSSSRPVSGRRQHALIMERLVHVETPRPAGPRLLTTADFARRWMKRHGITSWSELTDQQYAWLIEHSSDLADRWNQRMRHAAAEQAS